MVTVILRKAYGAYIIGSKSSARTWRSAWPDAQIAVMGAEGAASIMYRRDLLPPANRTFEETKASLWPATRRFVNPEVSCPRNSAAYQLPPPPDHHRFPACWPRKDQRAPHVKRHDNGPL